VTQESSVPGNGSSSSAIDVTVAHSPRIWNYWLGGKDNYEVDRQVGDDFVKMFPQIVDIARSSRAFLGRAVQHLVGEVGIRQFLDIGTGLPTVDNTHELVQRIAPEARIVYVDNDPVVLAHARVLLLGTPQGHTTYIDADLHDTAAVLAAAAESLDFEQPIALVLNNILGHVPDFDEARAITARLLDALAPGSHLVVSDGITDGGAFDAAIDMWNQAGSLSYTLRTPEQIAQYFDGLELLEPGVVSCPFWRPAASGVGAPTHVDEVGAVGRKA
jgi:O-methyltransferase involved in polyketide biosynthesis